MSDYTKRIGTDWRFADRTVSVSADNNFTGAVVQIGVSLAELSDPFSAVSIFPRLRPSLPPFWNISIEAFRKDK